MDPYAQGALLLLPNLLGDVIKEPRLYLSDSTYGAMTKIDGLIAESEGGGRRYLKRFETKKPAHLMPIALLNKHTKEEDLDFLLEPIFKNKEVWGIVSDAGLPCIADPGSDLVYRARQRGILVDAFTGPSSIFLALMLSGLSAQRFYFQGYLGRQGDERARQLKHLEKQSAEEEATQVCMDAPHRSNAFLKSCLESLKDTTLLTVAVDLTLSSQSVETFAVSTWKKRPLPQLDGRPTLFLFSAQKGR
ncbi:MAG: putative tetrapyrrole methylase [Chlamydiales bacterium]|jgi:16S rRNA (cytidine1402-2'-O)-methyltransferase|nr:putative tetrapyrrole methylase [Chlamydiales bacterium]